ncbi:type IIL restriction-modification enzyme MmeI [Chloroflexota bacterium]
METQRLYHDGESVPEINSNLTAGVNLTKARRLKENLNIAFIGPSPKVPFDINKSVALPMLNASLNINGRPNSDVVRPVVSAIDIGRRPRGKWTIDFGLMDKEQAAFYELPFEYVKKNILPLRANRRDDYRGQWWQYARPRPEMRAALIGKSRYLVTPRVAKHRVFIWLNPVVLANDGTVIIAKDDDYTFGILQSSVHELWARGLGTQLREAESGFRYTPTTTFETFPFPKPTPEQAEVISQSAKQLNELRERWLSPAGDEVGPSELKLRTLTNLYNDHPTWLELAHKKLDEAVLLAYGWGLSSTSADILARLLALNLEREPANNIIVDEEDESSEQVTE